MAALADEVGDVPVPQGRRGVGGGLQGSRPGQDSTAFGGADNVDTPVPLDRGGRAWRRGLQGFSQEQNSIAFRGADHGDIPVPPGRGAGGCLHAFSPGQGSSASSSMDRSYVAEGALDGFFSHFCRSEKSAWSASQCGDHPLGYFSLGGVVAHSSSWSPAACGHGTLPVEDDGQGDFFQDGDEEEEEEEALEMFDESIDRFELAGWRPRRPSRDYMAGCRARGWGCTCAHGEQELHPSSLPGALHGRAGVADHG